MVKNFGGNKSKKQGRKFLNNSQPKATRFIKEEGEMYAVVKQLSGGRNCVVLCFDGVSRICVIRNKFCGRGKRDNTLVKGTWIMVGLRSWENRSDGKQFCDLLEVYSNDDKDKIKSSSKLDFSVFASVDDNEKEGNELEFIDEETEYYEDAQNDNNVQKVDFAFNEQMSEIEIDDI
tara:strand:+ start:1077 stop:1604 length:528 start_codon:yes stop_codon:yes gene_type:complete